MSFDNRPAAFSIDYIDQGAEGDNAWMTFVLDTSEGFTQPGIDRIIDSIRTYEYMYFWAILGMQAQICTSILCTIRCPEMLRMQSEVP